MMYTLYVVCNLPRNIRSVPCTVCSVLCALCTVHFLKFFSGGSVKKGSPIINKNLQRNPQIPRKNKSPKISKKSTKTAAEPKTSKHVVKTSKKEQKENVNDGSDYEGNSHFSLT